MTNLRVTVSCVVAVVALLLMTAVYGSTRSLHDVDIAEEDGENAYADMYAGAPMTVPPQQPRHGHTMKDGSITITRRMSGVFLRALGRHDLWLMMPLLDRNTILNVPSTLPWGGLYKGQTGMLMFLERLDKTLQFVNQTRVPVGDGVCRCQIMEVDEDRGTAAITCHSVGVVRRTARAFHATWRIVLQFALTRLVCIDFTLLNEDEVKAAFETRAEAAACRLGEAWFAHGDMAPQTLQLFADNFTLHFSAVEPTHLLTIRSKKELLGAITRVHTGQPVPAACKLLHCLLNHTQQTLVLHSDDSRVVTINFASVTGGLVQTRKMMDSFTEGLVLPDTGRIDSGVNIYYTISEFDQSGKLYHVTMWLNRPLTLLDRVYLRNTLNISISTHSDLTDDTHTMM